jgi:hypothetical protein
MERFGDRVDGVVERDRWMGEGVDVDDRPGADQPVDRLREDVFVRSITSIC